EESHTSAWAGENGVPARRTASHRLLDDLPARARGAAAPHAPRDRTRLRSRLIEESASCSEQAPSTLRARWASCPLRDRAWAAFERAALEACADADVQATAFVARGVVDAEAAIADADADRGAKIGDLEGAHLGCDLTDVDEAHDLQPAHRLPPVSRAGEEGLRVDEAGRLVNAQQAAPAEAGQEVEGRPFVTGAIRQQRHAA